MMTIMRIISTTIFILLCAITSSYAQPYSDGQTVYVPAYSHIYHGNKERPLLLSITLSIRNIDPKTAMTISSVEYNKTEGGLVRHFLKEPRTVPPLGAIRYVVNESDNTGGSGASFLVKWNAKQKINPPIIETVMIGTQSQLGVSFTSRGEAIE